MGEVLFKLHMWIIMNVSIRCMKGMPLSDNNGTKPQDLNGQKLQELGRKLNLPKLRLIGKTIENIEEDIDSKIKNLEKETAQKLCKHNPCLEWTEWSQCSSNVHLFGSKSRTRECSLNKTACTIDTKNTRIEKEFGICGGLCPDDYTDTKNGFCLKLYKDKARTKDSAELKCKEDGGHLINIDSEIKYEDVQTFPKQGDCVWIDGQRKDVSSPWQYTHGSQKGFFKWASGQPNDNTNELCVCHFLDIRGWHDVICTRNRYSICEITTNN